MMKPTLRTGDFDLAALPFDGNGLPRRKGREELVKLRSAERLTDRQKIAAHCYVCSCGYETGRGCTSPDCPVVPHNPYNQRPISPIGEAFLHWAEGLSRKLGRAEYVRYLKGGRLTRRPTIAAACIRCKAGYYLGEGCDDVACALYLSNPYVLAKKKAVKKPLRDVHG